MKPSMKTVVAEQLRVVGLAIRWEAALLCCALFALLAAIGLSSDVMPEGTIFVDPTFFGYPSLLLGLAAPLGVWKGDITFGDSPLWSAPVDHARHAFIKALAGWVWLMGLVAFGIVVVVISVHLVGDSLSVDTRLLLPDGWSSGEISGPLPAVDWTTPLWQWLVPFASGSAAYLAASALMVGVRKPAIWVAGIWLFLLGTGLAADTDKIVWLSAAADWVTRMFDLLGSAGAGVAERSVRLTSGERVRAWDQLPAFGSWASTTAIWLSVAAWALWAAARRPREG